MIAYIVPTYATPFYTQVTDLDGIPFQFTFTYVQRGRYWTLDVAAADGTVIQTGIKIVCSTDLFKKITNDLLPTGKLVAFSNIQDDDSPPDLDELGENSRVTLYYFTDVET